jgi:KH-domain-like of EngA bacterial GTPase enzymes, C-terminal
MTISLLTFTFSFSILFLPNIIFSLSLSIFSFLDATLWMAPPTVGSRSGRIYYCIQTSVAPPTIVVFCNDPALFTDNYQRYLERKVRDALDFEGTPLKIIWRGKTIRDVGRAARKGDVATTRITGKGQLGGGRPGGVPKKQGGKFFD